MPLTLKLYIKVLISVLIFFNTNIGFASPPEITDLIIGEWDYGWSACDDIEWSYTTSENASSYGINYYQELSGDCKNPPMIASDNGFPDEEYNNQERRSICVNGGFFPEYSILNNLAKFNVKNLQIDWEKRHPSDGVCYVQDGGFSILKRRNIECPQGYIWDNVPPLFDYKACIKIHTPEGDECPAKNGGGTSIGNPINVATGNKFHQENIDLSIDSLPFSLYYSSSTAFQNAGSRAEITLGKGWNHLYAKEASGIFKINGDDSVMIRRDDGKVILFTYINSQWQNISNTSDTLTKISNQWIVKSGNNQTETYNSQGKLIGLSNFGNNITLEYENGTFAGEFSRLLKISLDNGKYIDFEYFNYNLIIEKITDNNGRQWQFGYTNNNLTTITYPDNTVKEFHYGESGSHTNALTGITDRNSNRFSTYKYDGFNRVFHEWHHAQDSNNNEIKVEELTIDYHADNTRTITNSRGKVSTYTVEKNNGLWQIAKISGPGCSNCSNADTEYTYDPNTNDLLEKIVNGKITQYGAYDSKGQYGQKIEAFGTTEQRQSNYTYDPRFFKKPLTITEPSVYASNNKITTYSYDDNANILSMTESGFTADGTAVSATSSYQYNGPYKQISQVDGPRIDVADTTTFEYYLDDVSEGDNRGRLKQMTNAAGIVMRSNIQYTATGKILSEDKPNGLTTDYTYYAGNDRLETVSNSGSTNNGTKTITTHMDYLASGEIKAITRNYNTADASTLTLDYDNARRLIKITDQQGNYVQYELDTEGNQLSEKTHDPSNNLKKLISQVFDDYDQVDTSTQSGVTNNMDYGSDGNLYQQTNGNGIITDYSYDSLNRLTQISQDLNGTTATGNTNTAFEYDNQDRVTKVTDANNNHTLYQYDDLGRLSKLTSPDTGLDTFTYDGAGNITSKQFTGDEVFIDSFEATPASVINNEIYYFSYDINNRPIGIDYSGTDLDAIFSYDQNHNGLNQLTAFTDSYSSTALSYDTFGNLTSKAQTHNNIAGQNIVLALNYTFDANNRLSTITYPSGLVVTYSYNNLNQITDISTTINAISTNIISNVQYLPMGPLNGMSLGNGINYTSSYDNGYRLNSYQYGSTLSGTYSYDNNHNINAIARETAAINTAYQYDNLDRISQESNEESSENIDYSYDKLGNRLSNSNNGTPISYQYDANSNRLLQVGNAKRIYDTKGNTLTDGNHNYSYNTANRMASHNQGINTTNYQYNPIGQRIHKQTANTHHLYLYNANGQLLADSTYDTNANLSETRETIWLNNKPIAQVRTITGVSSIYYILSDHLNTPRKITDSTGTVLWSWNSDAFGTTPANQDVDGNGTDFEFNLRFPGQYFDKESGQHYNYFRDYEPSTGRYLESDPIGLEGGINSYIYTLANPINYFDSDGQAVQAAVLCGTPITATICVCGAIIYYWGTSGNSRRSNNSFSMDSGGGRVIPFPGNTPEPRSCKDNNCDDEKKRKNCQALKDSILATCAGLKGRNKFNCFHAADDAFDQCMED